MVAPANGFVSTSARALARPPVALHGSHTSRVAAAAIRHPTDIHSILSAVAVGRVDVSDACASLEEISSGLTAIQPQTEPTQVLNVMGMQAQQVSAALESIARRQQTAAARNVTADMYAAVRRTLPGVKYHAGAQMLMYTDAKANLPSSERLPGRVAIVCGFTSDLKSAFEAKVALGLMGGYSTMYQGISAADLPSVIQLRSALSDVDAVIVCCGEQPALAGLLSSLVSVPIVALPSAGRADPITAFDVAGVSAVAPDDGVAAAAVACRTLRVAAQYIQHRKDREELAYGTEMGADELSGELTVDDESLPVPTDALPTHNNVPK